MNAIIETAISLVLIFLVFSIVTYVIQELIAVNLQLRGKMLWKSISQMLDGLKLPGRAQLMKALPEGVANITEEFYNNAHIKGLQQDLKKLPSYIPSANFALALIDMVAKRAPAGRTGDLLADFRAGLQTFVNDDGNMASVLKNLLQTSTTIQDLQQKIEKWFNDYMTRVTGWYQSHVVATVRIIAACVTIFFNINSIKLAQTVYNDGQIRLALVAMAENVVDNPQTITAYYDKAFDRQLANVDTLYKEQLAAATTAADTLAAREAKDSITGQLVDSFTTIRRSQIVGLVDTLSSTGLPIGWKGTSLKKELCGSEGSSKAVNGLLLLLGWFITAAALCMGAPFWFDLLAKLVNVRRSGTKPKTDGQQGGEQGNNS